MTSGTPSMASQRSCTCCRVVTSAMLRPVALVISPSRRACAVVTMPLAIRMRIMKWPGVGLRWNTPTHFSRSLSSSAIVRHPSRAKRTRSSVTSRPSRSAFSASILFTMCPLLPARSRRHAAHAPRTPSAPAGAIADRGRRGSGCWRSCRTRPAGPSETAGSTCPRGSRRSRGTAPRALPRRDAISTKSPSWMPACRASPRPISRIGSGCARGERRRPARTRAGVPVIAHTARRENQREAMVSGLRGAPRARRERTARARPRSGSGRRCRAAPSPHDRPWEPATEAVRHAARRA